MPVSTAPIWSFSPSWGAGTFIETYSWLTCVMADNTQGAEQRQGMRTTPRRNMEATYTLLNEERTLLDLMIQAIGGGRWRVPLWMYATFATGLEAGATTVEQDIRGGSVDVGTELLVIGAYARDYEVVTVSSINVRGYPSFESPLTRSWVSAFIVPLREGELTDMPQVSRVSGNATNMQARFRLVGANHHVGGAPSALYYEGLPVITGRNADQGQGIQGGYQRISFELDGVTGGTYRVDTAGRGIILQGHSFVFQGTEEYNHLLDLLYYLKGQLCPVWLPSFANDFTLAEPYAAFSDYLVVNYVGFDVYGKSTGDCSNLFIELNNGNRFCCSIYHSTASGDGQTETLRIDSGYEESFDPRDVYAFCFLTKARLSADDIEVISLSGIEGTTTCQVTFRSEPDIRNIQGSSGQ